MLDLSLRGISKTVAGLPGVRDQVTYATSKALNRLGQLAQQDTISRVLPSNQHLRTQWFRPGMAQGFNLHFASKGNLEAVLGTRATWEGLQETGGGKKTRSGGHLAIPSKFWKPFEEIMAKDKKPRQILAG